ncbi:MAG: CAP domain-containing protein [Bacteroidota bacterium]|nr:CAP domain-containing protein [Bacteroidota bacterium]
MMKYLSLISVLLFAFWIPNHSNVFAQDYNPKIVKQLVNQARIESRYCGNTHYDATEPLESDIELDEIAQHHANDMAKNSLFSHIGSDGRNAEIRLDDAEFFWVCYGENIARQYDDEQELVHGWLKSVEHCKNIMEPSFTVFGFGDKLGYACILFVQTEW